jgi:two-component system chemotaxis sensor kinase CheA
MLDGQLYPHFRLHKLFNIQGAVTDSCHAMAIVLEGAGKRCALMVDELLGQQQAVIKSLGRALAHVPGLAGGAILSDGRVGFILDAAGLVHLAHGHAAAPRYTSWHTEPATSGREP